ncbi:basic proline-rich protein-like isoform X2 [Mesocricetus auratus]|uniref:Basic proline-rich protein-like isoform X2 n=1 Tax=Mesocricetus auratus TaxID=10036 RepID=A0ABM2YE52_MESAU|nr:basic proline-rich protein-like isoform X2 [Mesocricetus auratus]
MEVPAPEGAWSECGEQQEEEDRAGERGSLETPPRTSLAAAPSLSSRNSCRSPTPRRARAAPRPCPPPPIHQRRARALPGEKLPRWPGVNRHSGQRTKGKASHKAGRCGSRGLVSRSSAESSCEKRRWRPGGRPSVPAGLAGPQLPPPVRPEPAEVASGSRTQHPLRKVGAGTRAHTHTHTRPPGGGGPGPRPPRCALPGAAPPPPRPARTPPAPVGSRAALDNRDTSKTSSPGPIPAEPAPAADGHQGASGAREGPGGTRRESGLYLSRVSVRTAGSARATRAKAFIKMSRPFLLTVDP